jgi:hypothetical protein
MFGCSSVVRRPSPYRSWTTLCVERPDKNGLFIRSKSEPDHLLEEVEVEAVVKMVENMLWKPSAV